jgi:hypothetical protein
MGRSSNSVPVLIAVLKVHKLSVPALLVRARVVLGKMTGNTWFPAPRPSLSVLAAAIDDLTEAATTATTRVMGSVAARHAKRMALEGVLEVLRVYVHSIARANPEYGPAIIESAGMDVKKTRGPGPRGFRAKPGRVSGSVSLQVPQAGNRASYHWQYSVDGGVTWVRLPDTNTAHTTVTGLKPVSTVHFRYRTVVKNVTSDWSDKISILVR